MKAKVEVKRNLKLNNLKSFSVITLMILAFASGKMVAADDFKLWHASGKLVDKPLLHLETDGSKEEAVKMITELKHEDFVKKFSSEPFQMIEGIKEVIAKKEKDLKDDADKEEKLTTFKKDLLEAFKKVDDKHFGSDKAKAFFISAIEEALRDIKSPILLEKLFGTELAKAILALRAEKVTTPSPIPQPPVVTNPPTTPPTPVVGEVSDKELKDQAQIICDKFKQKPGQVTTPNSESAALKTQIEEMKKAMEAQLAAMQAESAKKDAALNELANQLATVPVNNQAQKREKGLEEILNPLLANLAKDDKNNDVQPPQAQQPLQQQRNNRDNDDRNDFNQPLPEPTQPQNQAQMPFFPSSSSSGLQVPVRLDLPSSSGRAELQSAQSVLNQLKGRQPLASTLSFNPGIPELVMAKAKVSSQKKTAQAALNNANEIYSRLDEQLEELKDGGRAALAPSVKQRQAQLQQNLQAKKSQMDQQKQTLGMLAPEQRDQVMPMLQGLQAEVATAEADLNSYNAQVEIAIEQGNSQIKAMAKRRDQLKSAATELESQISGLTEDETSAQQLINQAVQMQQQPQQQGVPNINRIQGAGRSATPSRVMSRAMNGSVNTSGNVMRGSLAGQTAAAKK